MDPVTQHLISSYLLMPVLTVIFGIAAYLDDTGNQFQNFGTPEYCAPEKEKAAV